MKKLVFLFLALTLPVVAAPVTHEIAGLKVSIWEPPTSITGPYPLIVFSHGFHGGRNQSLFLTQALAHQGYLVVAPDHADARGGRGESAHPSFKEAAKWSDKTFHDREEDIEKLLEGLHHSDWSAEIDWDRIGLSGHSLGGYTTVSLAGGWPSWKLSKYKIRAVLALSPYVAPLVGQGDLGHLGLPVMYQGGTLDFGITPSVKRAGGAYDKTAGPAYFVEFRGAGHMAWTNMNPKFHGDINYYSLAFFNRYLKNGPAEPLTQKRGTVAELIAK